MFGFSNGVKIYFQKDGNFVAYKGSDAVAAAASNSTGDNLVLIFQDDGNMCVYQDGKALWHSNTAPAARGGHLVLQPQSPYMQIIGTNGQVHWKANEGHH